MEQKSNKGLIRLIVILIILVIGLMSFIVYKEFFVDNNTVQNNNVDNITNNTTQKVEEKKLTESELEKYLSYVPFCFIFDDAYVNKKVDINNVNQSALLYTVFNSKELKHYDDNKNCFMNSCVPEQDFNKRLNEMYNITIDDFSSQYNETEKKNIYGYLVLEDGNYYESGGYGGGKYKSKTSKVSYEIINSELIINEQLGIISESGGYVKVFNGDKVVKEYDLDTNNSDVNFEEQAEQYVKDNIQDFNTYKHIFKLNENNTYYWISTEVLN